MGLGKGRPRDPSHALVEGLIRDVSVRIERFIAWGRIVFCLLVLARYFVIGGATSPGSPLRTGAVIGAVTIAVAASTTFLLRAHRHRAGPRDIAALVVLDALVAFVMLATNIFWPGDLYEGILVGLDPLTVLVIVLIGGVRLSVGLAALGGVAHLASILTLVALDFAVGTVEPQYGVPQTLMFVVLVIAASVVSAAAAYRARLLAERSAGESVRLEDARRGLSALLEGHHDAHSIASTLSLTTDLIARAAERGQLRDVTRLARGLRDDLAFLTATVGLLKESARGELTVSEPIADVALGPAIERVASSARSWAPALRVEATEDAPVAAVAGGELGLSRILLNLLRNAQKGDGARGARTITVRVQAEGEHAALIVEDDGPGLSTPHRPGVGLSIVERITQQSGGELTLEAAEPHGVRARVRFPRARAPGAREVATNPRH